MPEAYAGPDGPGSDLDLVLEFVFTAFGFRP